MYRYKISQTGYSSDKLGNCEICGGHASEVSHMVEERKYKYGYTRLGCQDIFGHVDCSCSSKK